MRKKSATPQFDPHAYDGPLRRADGKKPYNSYLWPLDEDWFWANQDLGHRISSRFEFSVVALADGRWATDGFTFSIERDRTCYGERCNFPTRSEAIRAAGARLIRLARNARRWRGTPDHLSEANAQRVIDWARAVIARETNAGAPENRILRPLPAPRPRTGLPLFDADIPETAHA